MDLSYMQREATDLAIDRLIHCAPGDFGNDTCTYFVGTARSKWHSSIIAGKRPVRCIQCDTVIQGESHKRLKHVFNVVLMQMGIA